ncbi:hypothetical protein FBU59_006773, partial [Linderina macrospora]
MPWDSDDDDDVPVSNYANGNTARALSSSTAYQAQPAVTKTIAEEPVPKSVDPVAVAAEEAPQKKKPFSFLHKGSKEPKDSSRKNEPGKFLKRQSKKSEDGSSHSLHTDTRLSSVSGGSNSNATSTSTATGPAPSIPTPALGLENNRASFADEASEAIVNLKIVESPPPVQHAAGEPIGRQLAESDSSDSDSDAPLGNRLPGQQQQQPMMQQQPIMGQAMSQPLPGQQPMQYGSIGPNPTMHRASTAMPAFGGMQQQQPMMPGQTMLPGQAMAGMQMMMGQDQMQHQMMMQQQQQQQMMNGAMPMGFANGQRPITYMDAMAGNGVWGGQQQPMGMMAGGGLLDGGGAGPLLTVEKK